MNRVAVLRWRTFPSFVTWEVPNPEELLAEDRLVLDAFAAVGSDAASVVWSAPETDWSAFDAALIRSTWDYIDDPAGFVRVLSAIEASSCRLFNPLPAVRWNMEKHYLFDLERAGVPIVPTVPSARLDAAALPAALVGSRAETAIIKPMIGAAGSDSRRIPMGEVGSTLARLRADEPQREYLVQPFVDSVVEEGEWSFVYFDRRLSHVLRRRPAPADYRVQGIYGGSVEVAEPTGPDVRQADAILARLPFDLLYARLDLVRIGGELAVMEVELIEPILSLDLFPAGAARLAGAVRDRLDG